MPKMTVSHSAGKLGEKTAAEYLISRGYSIICRNYRKKSIGEIDIIALCGIRLAFVEVKARRTGSMISALESVTKGKQIRIIKTSKCFFLEYSGKLGHKHPYYDVIDVQTTVDGKEVISIRHYENAFSPTSFRSGTFDFY